MFAVFGYDNQYKYYFALVCKTLEGRCDVGTKVGLMYIFIKERK